MRAIAGEPKRRSFEASSDADRTKEQYAFYTARLNQSSRSDVLTYVNSQKRGRYGFQVLAAVESVTQWIAVPHV